MRDKLLKTAINNARLIIKSKGKIEGNFFLVEGSVGKENGVPAGLAITLRVKGKDPEGTRIKSMGMKLRQLHKEARFTWGQICCEGNKLFVHLEGKKLKNPTEIRNLFQGLGKEGNLSVLGKVKVLGAKKEVRETLKPVIEEEAITPEERTLAEAQTDTDASQQEDELLAQLAEDPELQAATAQMAVSFAEWETQTDEEVEARTAEFDAVENKVDQIWPTNDSGEKLPLQTVLATLAADPEVQALRNSLQGPIDDDPPWLASVLVYTAEQSLLAP